MDNPAPQPGSKPGSDDRSREDGCPPPETEATASIAADAKTVRVTGTGTNFGRAVRSASYAPGEKPGDMIGPYKLLEVLGVGGFGTVWLAERRAPMVQRVALKVINPGMDSREVLARFEQERQALAVMDHPNVAKVFDAGATETGRPYFVMEHVAGEPITTYCDRNTLSMRARLELFIPICEAVQHAHHKGIIHRDLKPSNILVSIREGKPIPKVIDFGVAKAISHTLTDKSIFTQTGQIIGTPEYMSPEQAEMGATDIDTRTDVYSLGVVLYELLSGMLPLDTTSLRSAGYGAMQKLIRDQEPARPSTRVSTADDQTGAAIAKSRQAAREVIARELRRELDWIPMKALRKDRAERYGSPADLAKDVRRYLDGEALEAGPESAAYRMKKFARRYRGPVVAATVVVGVLVLGIIGTTWGFVTAANRAEGERRAKIDAQEQRQKALNRTFEAETSRVIADMKSKEAAEAAAVIEYNSYVANVQMAAAAMDFRQFDRVRQRLKACPERLRGWEWRWLNAEADNSLAELKGHTVGVTSASFSPDGTRIVTASGDKTARVWDAVTGSSLLELKGHTVGVTSASFSPDGTRIVTASGDKTARVWDAVTGSSLLELKGHTSALTSAAFSPDGTRIVTASGDKTARVWDAVTGSSLLELKGHTSALTSAAFSSDGTRIVTASWDKTARVWDAVTGEALAELKGHTIFLTSASFSPDGTRIVTASGDDTARMWDAVTGSSLLELKGHTRRVTSAAFSPDGTRIVTASDDTTARVWDAVTGSSLAELKGHTREFTSAAFSPDGTWVVTASWDKTARVWDAATGSSLLELKGHTGVVTSVAFSPDGTRIVTASGDKTARVWDAVTGSSLLELKGHTRRVTSASFSPDGTRIVTASWDDTARVWDAVTGSSLLELKGHTGQVTSAAFSPDGTRIVTASGDKTARVWDAVTGSSLLELKGHTSALTSAAFSPDGTRIVTASWDTTAWVWDAATGSSLLELKRHAGRVLSASFNPDGTRIITVSLYMNAWLWDAVTGSSLLELKGHKFMVTSAAFSPDGTRIVTASDDKTARVWDAVSGSILSELVGHTGDVVSASFSPDGTRVVTASWDTTTRVWDAVTGSSLAELKGHTVGVTSAAFSPDGTRIVTASDDNTARVWESVPYRDRYPAIDRFRRERARLEPILKARLEAGESSATLRTEFGWLGPSQTPEKHAAMAILHAVEVQLREVKREKLDRANELNSSAWPIVRFAERPEGSGPDAVQTALEQARQAVELAPESQAILNTLGVAQYRAGLFAESITTLVRSEEMYVAAGEGEQPGNWAFIALARHRQGQAGEAAAARAKFEALAAEKRWAKDNEVKEWVAEVARAFGGK